jgi:hypothetical protein
MGTFFRTLNLTEAMPLFSDCNPSTPAVIPCTSSSRLLVHEKIAKVLAMLRDRYEVIKEGLGKGPMENDTFRTSGG